MADDRISALEHLVETRREDRDRQLGDIAVDVAENKEGLTAVAHRVSALESIKQPSVITYWGPAIATLAMVGAIGGAFLTMMQREQEARELVVDARMKANTDKISELRIDARFLDSQLRGQDKDFRGALSAVEARQQMLEKQMDAIDFRGSRKWVGKE